MEGTRLEGSVRSGVEPGGDVGEGAGPLHQARQPRGQLQQLGVVSLEKYS